MKTSEQLDKIAPALIKAQSEMSAAIKDSKNPFYKTNYANMGAVLQAVMPAMLSNDICVTQSLSSQEGKPYLCTRLLHASGQFIEDTAPIHYERSEKQNLLQSFGSAISYMRRYALVALLSVNQEDDDGEGAGSKYIEPKVECISLENQTDIINMFRLCTLDFQEKLWKVLTKEYGELFLWKEFPLNRFEKLMQHMKAHVSAQSFDVIAKECK